MASVGFKWLDILEKEFDKSFVDLDLAIGELDSDEPDIVFNVRQKLCTLSSCFAQLAHKAQTIFQNSAKIEAELINMRTELVESKAKREVLEQELHTLLLQLHASQLAQFPDNLKNKKLESNLKPDIINIKKKLDAELRESPLHSGRLNSKDNGELKLSPQLIEEAQYRAENNQLHLENAALRNTILSLSSEVYGAKLAAKYLDKELAGRIQQLQLLGREMRGDVRDKLWRQLESEILLQRHKTVIRACRRNSLLNGPGKACPKPPEIDSVNEKTQHFGDIRTVYMKRNLNQGLGISITGGREHGVPILISELEPSGPAALCEQLYIGDAILSVNDVDLRQACHKEAVEILQQQTGDCVLKVQYVAADDSDNSLEEDGYNFRFFDKDVNLSNTTPLNSTTSLDKIVNTPTAPRTPDSYSAPSRVEINHHYKMPEEHTFYGNDLNILNYNFNTCNRNDEELNKNVLMKDEANCNNKSSFVENINKNLTQLGKLDLILFDTSPDNLTNNSKNVSEADDCLNCSTTSLNSENFSSPMQTSTDWENPSSDPTSSDSSKNINSEIAAQQAETRFGYDKEVVQYASTESLSEPKSDQSLLNSEYSCTSSPAQKVNTKCYKTGQKKRHFAVKTLQSIFSKHGDGYSDISSTASEAGEELPDKIEDDREVETTSQFEENIHNIISDIFAKNTPLENNSSVSSIFNKSVGPKKYFSLHGQNLRVGKALRLCPNESYNEQHVDNARKREKLLARYVYSANSVSADGVGDPDFGTPV